MENLTDEEFVREEENKKNTYDTIAKMTKSFGPVKTPSLATSTVESHRSLQSLRPDLFGDSKKEN